MQAMGIRINAYLFSAIFASDKLFSLIKSIADKIIRTTEKKAVIKRFGRGKKWNNTEVSEKRKKTEIPKTNAIEYKEELIRVSTGLSFKINLLNTNPAIATLWIQKINSKEESKLWDHKLKKQNTIPAREVKFNIRASVDFRKRSENKAILQTMKESNTRKNKKINPEK